MSIAVTGATGQLGRLVVEALITRGTAPSEIVAVVRDSAKAGALSARGVQVRVADYDAPETLTTAFAGVDKLLLISGNAVGQRVPQHTAVINAAKAAGVGFLAYTSLLRADTSTLGLGPEHKATEELIAASGIPFALLRNGWYIENYTGNLAGDIEHGAIYGASGEGRIAAATRGDYAEAAAAVLISGETGVFELGGTTPFTKGELAAAIAQQSGKPVEYRNLSVADFQAALVGAGLPEAFAGLLADTDGKVVDGELDTDSTDLQRLISRPSTPLDDAIATELKG
ncbi:SDR family oxidoreductase [Actinoplanes sp. NBRC 101535]|uniref:SDR family oxidoreductase n=1 Tax=Actinoplanes sp. NBRC 101535 TaxID=3032196 RepID=UPI0024A46730|nr:SDR family oxidoreductase [Actinoplanes sp. NBRC 101535]GLY04300.1 NAD(P)-dependent oxidoreductase [Actinoplanes sp. NBRC 101535]